MTKRERLTEAAIETFLGAHAGWERVGEALTKTFSFDSYAAGIAFVVEVGFAAEGRDHHPELMVGWRRVKVSWSTHDAGGITAVDAEMAERTEAMAR